MQEVTPTVPSSDLNNVDVNKCDNVETTPIVVPPVLNPVISTEKGKKKRIKNKYYVEFLEKGTIQYIDEKHIDAVTRKFSGKNRDMSLSLIYCLYLTGARPIEVLNLKAKDIVHDGQYVKIQISGAKNGLPRPIYVKWENKYAKHIYEYARQLMPEMYIHYAYRGKYVRTIINKKGIVKTYAEISRPVRSNFAKWFAGILGDEPIVPYHLRHNRFSKLSEAGATLEEMRITKGSKTYQSITPYIHMSSERGKKMARFIN